MLPDAALRWDRVMAARSRSGCTARLDDTWPIRLVCLEEVSAQHVIVDTPRVRDIDANAKLSPAILPVRVPMSGHNKAPAIGCPLTFDALRYRDRLRS